MYVKDYHFRDAADRPFFWLADTAWNIALRAGEAEWEAYLTLRAEQGFTVIQFVATQWRGCSNPRPGPLFEVKRGGAVDFNERAWKVLDRFVEMVRNVGLVPAPVMLWANTPGCPGQSLSESQAIELGRWQVERWSGGAVFWLLAGDGAYEDAEAAKRWCRIGRGIFHDRPDALVTMHPHGVSWPTPNFRNEPWFRFSGVQSGHGVDEAALRFLVNGPMVKEWASVHHPILNLEPNYEMARAYGTDIILDDYYVRRASWWSVLSWPTAGITYGNNPIWIWGDQADNVADGHETFWRTGPWCDGLKTPAIGHMGILRRFMEKLPWYQLRPAGDVLIHQPGERLLEDWIAVAATSRLLVAYLPKGGGISLKAELLPGKRFRWFDPRTGHHTACEELPEAQQVTLYAPDESDWVLFVGVEEADQAIFV